ncbi:unnamed protein product [Arabis nemorensis]|uniref:DNA (cytosine-5-)-methyltransferase n=1 Tax=Arabis nemorensis TaxID=586526 RepID=A0A565BZJ8_9BRAS|nr:unnamed protein product [Arabis nemorensis]
MAKMNNSGSERKIKAKLNNSGSARKLKTKVHYNQAVVDGVVLNLGDDVYVQVIKAVANYKTEKLVQDKRVFLTNVEDDNSLNCILSKVNVSVEGKNMALENEKRVILPSCDFFYDMTYELDHFTFSNADDDIHYVESDESTISNEDDSKCGASYKKELDLLDLYSGCGTMSTGLTMGSSLSGVKLKTVINEAAEDFLSLLKEWRRLCQKFGLVFTNEPIESDSDTEYEDVEESNGYEIPPDDSRLESYSPIVMGIPRMLRKLHLRFILRCAGRVMIQMKIRGSLMMGYDKLKEFVTKGFKKTCILCVEVLHVKVSAIFNRFRNPENPFEEKKNWQLVVYMDIIDYLKPKYVFLENVVDLLKFSKGFLARYAIARLVNINYQTRLGIMSAGTYGVPQCRNRVFLWGAQPTSKLPPFPLATHEVQTKNVIPKEFEATNYEKEDKREYKTNSRTDFQKFIRLKRADTLISVDGEDNLQPQMLFDHQPLRLIADDYERVYKIPKKKVQNIYIDWRNFRDLGGVIITKDNVVRLDLSVKRATVKSGNPLIPDYALSCEDGKSLKPFGRLWWDEIVNTVVTRAQPHNQVGNAVAVPVWFALGYALGMGSQGLCDDKSVIELPIKYPQCLEKKDDAD